MSDLSDLDLKRTNRVCCVDCGVNTAPGCSNRAEVEQAFKALRASIKQ
jgi:hypothetical protein